MRMKTKIVSIALFLLSFIVLNAQAQTVKKTVNPDNVSDATQFGYSQAVIASNVNTIYVSGQVGFVAGKDNGFEEQVDRAFESLAKVIKAAGGNVQDVVKITLLIKDYGPDKLEYLVQKRRSFFGPDFPASTLIPVARLFADDVSFEIDAIVAVPTE